MSITEELEKLEELHRSGTITDEEFAAFKSKLLSGQSPDARSFTTASLNGGGTSVAELEQKANLWGFFLHLSGLAGFVVPVAGLVVPVVIWQLKKDELPRIDEHGKNAINWMISAIIYAVASVILAAVLIGFVLLAILAVVSIVFPVIAAVKANKGEVWKYPLSISFMK